MRVEDELWVLPECWAPPSKGYARPALRGVFGMKAADLPAVPRGVHVRPIPPFRPLDEAQAALHVLARHGTGGARVEGGPGTGKTFTVLHALSERTLEVQRAGGVCRVWVVATTTVLVARLRELIHEVAAETRVSPEAHCMTLAKLLQLPDGEGRHRALPAQARAAPPARPRATSRPPLDRRSTAVLGAHLVASVSAQAP